MKRTSALFTFLVTASACSVGSNPSNSENLAAVIDQHPGREALNQKLEEYASEGYQSKTLATCGYEGQKFADEQDELQITVFSKEGSKTIALGYYFHNDDQMGVLLSGEVEDFVPSNFGKIQPAVLLNKSASTLITWQDGEEKPFPRSGYTIDLSEADSGEFRIGIFAGTCDASSQSFTDVDAQLHPESFIDFKECSLTCTHPSIRTRDNSYQYYSKYFRNQDQCSYSEALREASKVGMGPSACEKDGATVEFSFDGKTIDPELLDEKGTCSLVCRENTVFSEVLPKSSCTRQNREIPNVRCPSTLKFNGVPVAGE